MTSPLGEAALGRIVIIMQSRENCRLLSEWLATRYEVEVPAGLALPAEPFDLCIIDGPSLEQLWEEVQARKQQEAPAFLPFLFVAMRADVRMISRFLYRAVDEMIFMPSEKIELAARLENLLRSRRNSVQLARQNADMFAGLVEESPLGVFLGRAGRYFYVNRAGAELLGYASGDQVAEVGPLALVAEPDRARVAEKIAALERGAVSTAHYSFLGLRKDGSTFACEAFERMVAFQGRPARLRILVDTTEREALEAERERVARGRIEDLQRADELKDQFLGILSHELRTPLNAILGFGSILADELPGELNPAQHGYLAKMLDGADVLLSLISDLLDMSRIQAGKFQLTRSALNVGSVAREVIDRLAGLAKSKDLAVTLEVAGPLPAVDGDAQRVAQIFTNLLGNAIKFTAPGGRIGVSVRREKGFLRCEVADTGPGIKPADVERLFQPFSQLDMSATRVAGGTGLGLSITKALVENHGGRIGVDTEPGRGSTFWFTLPIPAALT
jgi:PAS domain S-box-containing protein